MFTAFNTSTDTENDESDESIRVQGTFYISMFVNIDIDPPYAQYPPYCFVYSLYCATSIAYKIRMIYIPAGATKFTHAKKDFPVSRLEVHQLEVVSPNNINFTHFRKKRSRLQG